MSPRRIARLDSEAEKRVNSRGLESCVPRGIRRFDKPGLNTRNPPSPSATPAVVRLNPVSVETLRAKLDAAIVAEEWGAVTAINARLRELERSELTGDSREAS
jgi:hypothetical protein